MPSFNRPFESQTQRPGAIRRFPFSRVIVATGLAAALAAATIFPGCSKKEAAAPARRAPMILFAVDGLEWRVLKPLLDAGKLPTIEGLMKRGSYGYLSSMQPTYSAVVWTSVATGKMPQKHGITHFVYEETSGGKKEYSYFTSGHRKTKAFWNILSDYDLTVDCIGWWMTYPAEPVNGLLVSQTNTTAVLQNEQAALWRGSLLKGVEGQVYPPDRQDRVMGFLGDVDAHLDRITEETFGKPPYPPDDFGRLMWEQTQWAFRADATYVRIARDLLETGQPFDLLALYIGGTDVAAHRFWWYAYPKEYTNPPDEKQIANFGRVIDDEYMFVDRTIGELLALAPKDTAVLIVSDHGMHSMNNSRKFEVASSLAETNSAHHLDSPPGVIIGAGGPFVHSGPSASFQGELDLTSLPRLGSVLDVLPTILAAKGIPIGEDMDGAPLRGILDVEKMGRSDIRYIPTHDTAEWLAGRHQRMRHAVDESERLQQLRSLGYIK